MKIKLYVNWIERKIVTASSLQFEKIIEEKAKAYYKDEVEFDEFLAGRYHNLFEVFNMADVERIKCLQDWKEVCAQDARNNIEYEYDVIEIEI